MDKTTIKILDTITSNIGEPLSINQLTNRMKYHYGTAYYANIYQKLQELKNNGLINLEPIGRSSIIKLNFDSYLLIDTLSEMEIEKKLQFLSQTVGLSAFYYEMDKILSEKCCLRSITAINPQKNTKLNRIDLLSILNKTSDHQHQTIELLKATLNLQRKYNTKINNLILEKNDFNQLSTIDTINPVREALSEQITLYNPQAFWRQIIEAAQKTQIKTLQTETKPLSITDTDLNFNLNRLGYREFGAKIVEGKKYCVEYIATALLLREEARGLDAVAVILAKNNFNSNLLGFLSQKYEASPTLLGILEVLGQTASKPEVEDTLKILKAVTPQVVPADKESIRQKLELYNAL